MRTFAILVPLITAIFLSGVFWSNLWSGGGFVGGDTYSYYLPQKAWYADRWQAGELPLWNSLAGHGYPLVGESQTGAFYPVNVVLYRLLDIHTAYNVSHLGHYIAAFVLTSLLARRLRLSRLSSLLASLIFVYGWFPPRVSLEWAIIGGVWFAWEFWCAESYLQTARARWLLGLSAGLGLHLLAGHYHLAFIGLVALTVYVPARLWFADEWLAESVRSRRGRAAGCVLGSVCLGFALAAVQLWPSWELKRLSQRVNVNQEHDPSYGHIPPLYLSQLILPWSLYSPDVDTEKAIRSMTAYALPARTNKVEAHLYFGLLPWLIVVAGLISLRVGSQRVSEEMSRGREGAVGISGQASLPHGRGSKASPARSELRCAEQDGEIQFNLASRMSIVWLGLSLFAVLNATGLLLPITRYWPGFSYFAGLGRFGMVTTLGVGILMAAAFDQLVSGFRATRWRCVVFAVVFALTVCDLVVVSKWVRHCFPTSSPPIHHRADSPIRRLLSRWPQPPRLFAPGPNLPTLTGFAATPQYLGIAPHEYFDPQLKLPEGDDPADPKLIAAQVEWLRRAGVSHILRFEPLPLAHWPVRPVWQGIDPMLHLAWGRSADEPLYLYELLGTRGRAAFADPHADETVRITDYRANQVTLQCTSAHGGEVILTDLFYPGWEVTIDGQPAEARRVEGMYRGVAVSAGEHTIVWTFRPKSVSRGLLVSVIAAFVWFSVLVRRGLKDGWLTWD